MPGVTSVPSDVGFGDCGRSAPKTMAESEPVMAFSPDPPSVSRSAHRVAAIARRKPAAAERAKVESPTFSVIAADAVCGDGLRQSPRRCRLRWAGGGSWTGRNDSLSDPLHRRRRQRNAEQGRTAARPPRIEAKPRPASLMYANAVSSLRFRDVRRFICANRRSSTRLARPACRVGLIEREPRPHPPCRRRARPIRPAVATLR